MADPKLVKATTGAPANTLKASNYKEISNMGAIDRVLPTSSGLANASVNEAQEQVAAAKRAAALARQRQEDMSDPRKYRRVPKKDGGFDFFDPEGNQVDIATLTERTQTKPIDWIKDSQNPIDIQYLEDSNNLEDYIKAKLSKNTQKITQYEANTALGNYQGKGGADQLINDFKKHYERYYVPRTQNPNAWGSVPSDQPFVPAPQSDNSGYGIGTPTLSGQ